MNRSKIAAREVRIVLSAMFVLLAAPLVAPAQYHTYSGVGQELSNFAAAYPDLCELYVVGTSVQGRSIWALRISDNLAFEEDEPEVKLISTIHGDEWVGTEMLLNLIDHLLSNYGSEPQATRLVNELDLWIIPLMNPDGFVSVTRGNAHGVDLNRDFPDPYTSPNNSPAGREPETAAIMNWSFTESFVLSANLHTGELVVNYPYDANPNGSSVYTACPDDDLFVYISNEYASRNPPMHNSPFFDGGITNGADWYVVYGGMQDWNYRYVGCNEVTIELSTTKIPSANQLPQYWNDNRDALLAYLDTALIGLRGVVTDADSGAPLMASVEVGGRDHLVFTDPDVGDYHRMLLPGTYSVIVHADGYDRVTVPDFMVSPGDAARLDVALEPPPVLERPFAGVTLQEGRPALLTWQGSVGGQYEIEFTTNADAVSDVTEGFEAAGLPPAYMSGGNAAWITTTSSAHSGSRAARAGTITHNQSSWMERTVSGDSTVSFWYRVSSESGYDFLTFYVDGSAEGAWSGTVNWSQFTIQLGPGDHTLRWEYAKDVSVSSGSDTAWVDDVRVQGSDIEWQPLAAATPPGAASVRWAPRQSGAACRVRMRALYGGGAVGEWVLNPGEFTIAPSEGIEAFRPASGAVVRNP